MELGKKPDNIISKDPRDKLYEFKDFYVFSRDMELAIDSIRTYISNIKGAVKFLEYDMEGESDKYIARRIGTMQAYKDFIKLLEDNISEFTTKDDNDV